jgi:hypothetical protein
MNKKWRVQNTKTKTIVDTFDTRGNAIEALDFRNTLCYALNIDSKNLYSIVFQ